MANQEQDIFTKVVHSFTKFELRTLCQNDIRLFLLFSCRLVTYIDKMNKEAPLIELVEANKILYEIRKRFFYVISEK